MKDYVTFSVPALPPSVNHAFDPIVYRDRMGYERRGKKLSARTIAFRNLVALFAIDQTVAPSDPRERKKVKYRVTIDVYLGPGDRGDADNYAKQSLDSLQAAGVIHSDAYVKDCHIEVHRDRRNDKGVPCTVFLVERV